MVMPPEGEEDMIGNPPRIEEKYEDIHDPELDMEHGPESKEGIFGRYAERRARAFEDILDPLLQTRERAGKVLENIPREVGDVVRGLPYSRGPAAIIEGLLGRKTGHGETIGHGESLKRVLVGSALFAGDVFLRGKGETLTGITLGYLEGKVDAREKAGEGDSRGARILRKTAEFVRGHKDSFEDTEKGVETVLHGQVK